MGYNKVQEDGKMITIKECFDIFINITGIIYLIIISIAIYVLIKKEYKETFKEIKEKNE